MSDSVTLPREVAEYLMEVLEECPMHGDWNERDCVALNALRAVLAAEQPLPSSTPIQQMVEEMIAESPEMAPYLRDARRQYILDAARWRFYETAGGDLTGRLHNTRSDHRNSVIDAAMEKDKR